VRIPLSCDAADGQFESSIHSLHRSDRRLRQRYEKGFSARGCLCDEATKVFRYLRPSLDPALLERIAAGLAEKKA
jgi:hypothetical protein